MGQFASFPMANFFALPVLSLMLLTLAWSFVAQPLPQDNLNAFQECSKLHPERFCRLSYLPSSIDKQR